MSAKTLLDLSGLTRPSIHLSQATIILIDYQNEYRSGPLTLTGVEPAIANAALLVTAARSAGTRIVHIAHNGSAGGTFDRTAARGAIVDELTPLASETVIEKPRPNAFSGTNLTEVVGQVDLPLIITGFMTHMCLSSTVRAALDLGYMSIVPGDACATRDLPTATGDIAAADLHRAELAALGDRFAWIVNTADLIGNGCRER